MEEVPKTNAVKRLKTIVTDQDNNQKINATIAVTLELYRVLVSTLLILFVPQKCIDHVCTIHENMETESNLYTTGLVFNFTTMFVFIIMYSVEIKRENKLITYLEVNNSNPTDSQSVGMALRKLSDEKRLSIIQLDQYYQKISYAAIVSFIINSILSGLVVYDYSLGNQTTTTIITNILFMVMKLVDVYTIINTEENVFYSAYLKGKVQFNDVDPDKAELIEMTTNTLATFDKDARGVQPVDSMIQTDAI
jgi:hypothetical protein